MGYQTCKTFDYYNNDPHSPNYYGYGHSVKKWKLYSKGKTCFKCDGEHDSGICNSDRFKCINCINANNNFNKKRNINDTANDRQIMIRIKLDGKKCSSTQNYPWRPEKPFKNENESIL